MASWEKKLSNYSSKIWVSLSSEVPATDGLHQPLNPTLYLPFLWNKHSDVLQAPPLGELSRFILTGKFFTPQECFRIREQKWSDTTTPSSISVHAYVFHHYLQNDTIVIRPRDSTGARVRFLHEGIAIHAWKSCPETQPNLMLHLFSRAGEILFHLGKPSLQEHCNRTKTCINTPHSYLPQRPVHSATPTRNQFIQFSTYCTNGVFMWT